MESFLIWIIQFTMQIYFQILGFIFKVIFQILGFIFKMVARGFGWVFHQGFKSFGSSVSSKNVLILGPGDSLKPGVRYQELFDYSQTASQNEVVCLTRGSYKMGDFWLGKYLTFQGNKAKVITNVWLPNEFLHQHVLVVGPTGAGKTELLLKSAENLMFKGNLVCVDAAGFLADRLANLSRNAGSKLVSWDLSG